jgi:hypothetical protein
MAITSDHHDKGRPSSWSSAVDQEVFGSVEEPNDKLLFFISAGNVLEEEWINYPVNNDSCSVADPAQAFNAIIVGAYTLKDQIDLSAFPGAALLSQKGGMGVCNSLLLLGRVIGVESLILLWREGIKRCKMAVSLTPILCSFCQRLKVVSADQH